MDWMLTISLVSKEHNLDFEEYTEYSSLGLQAIDNATRRIVSVPLLDHKGSPRIRRPVTVGLFFSLGHSTVVVITIIAIAISAKVANHLDGYGNIGSIIGASISGSFLILIGCINTVILYRTWSRLRQVVKRQQQQEHRCQGDGDEESPNLSQPRFNGFLTRLAMPILRTVDRPWKLFPVGLLFGLGFDTASSIALLSVAVIAQQDGGGTGSANGNVVLLAFLFTAGMTLVDSVDSCLMIWAYAPDLGHNGRKKLALWERVPKGEEEFQGRQQSRDIPQPQSVTSPEHDAINTDEKKAVEGDTRAEEKNKDDARMQVGPITASKNISSDPVVATTGRTEDVRSKPEEFLANLDVTASRLSLILTFLSILIAFAIGIIVLLGLIGDQCTRCSRAADKQEQNGSGGLEGRWWLVWRKGNDNSGYVGAAIVGLFAISVSVYFLSRWIQKKRKRISTAKISSGVAV